MAGILIIYKLGLMGINVDDDPLTIQDQEFLRTQNAIADPLLGNGLSKRPGLGVFNTNVTNGVILGGIGVPLSDLTPSSTTLTLYISRGPTS